MLLELKRDIKRFLLPFFLISLMAGAGFYVYVQKSAQQYTAAAVIEYKTTDGTAPDGTEIDTDEITSGEVISKACEELGDTTAADLVRQGIRIEPIVDEKEEALYEAKLEHGEDYKIINTKYKVAFSSGVKEGKDFPRRVLNAVLGAYFNYYGTYHSSVNLASNSIDDISYRGYDYLDTMDTINESLDGTLELLTKRISQNSTYRSAGTGYSFQDLYDEFSYLRNIESPRISAEIIEKKTTKNSDVLVTAYAKKNSDIEITNEVEKERIEKIEKIIDTYVSMMKESGNAKVDMDEKTLQEVFDTHGIDTWNSKADKTTEYDTLLTNYVKAKAGYSVNEIDYAYNQYICDQFKGAPASNANEQKKTERRIEHLMARVNTLYKILGETNEEYNEYLGAQNLSMLTNVSAAQKINTKQYTAMIAGAVFLMEILITAVMIRIRRITTEEANREQP